jgi:hypothetical protein
MIRSFYKYAQPLGTLLLSLFIASIFWCGDADCLKGNEIDECSSLLCAFFNAHDTTSQDCSSPSTSSCLCVCHLNAIPTVSTFIAPAVFLSSIIVVSPSDVIELPATPVTPPPLNA